MCVALNNSNAEVTPTKTEIKNSTVLKGGDENWYYYRVRNLKTYLNRKYGNPDFTYTITAKMTAADIQKAITGMQGIIVFHISGWTDASGHFTLWDGTQVALGNYFDPDNLDGGTLMSVDIWLLDK